jgi:hypothetical protein
VGRLSWKLGQGGAVSFIWGLGPQASVDMSGGLGTAHAHCSPLLASRVGDTKHGMMKFREDRSLLGLGLPSGGFHDRYFILNSSCLRLYKEVRVSGPMDSDLR